MNSYCQYNDAFSSKENDDLDKMARKINNDRKKLRKDVQNNIIHRENELCVGMDCLMDPANSRFAPSSLLPNFSFFSTQGDFSSDLPTPLNKKKKINPKSVSFASSDSKSQSSSTFSDNYNDIDSIYSFNSISSNYSSLNPKIKKHLRLSTTHLKNYAEKDDDAILKHIKKCDQCRLQLINLLQNENHIFDVKVSKENQKLDMEQSTALQNKEHFTGILNLSTTELKDVLILILIGIFIIILLDFFFKK